MRSFLSPLIDADASAYVLRNERSGAIVADELLPAFDSNTRKAGLLRHASLPSATAMIIAPCSAVHTFFMRFPIDVVYVARDGSVVKISPAVHPWRMSGSLRGHAVVEMAAGAVAQTGTVVGDRLAVVPR